jgi:hypothetical protein
MKLKQHFTTLKSQAKLENEDFNKFIEALPEEMEIPDIAVNLLAENFLTRQRAILINRYMTRSGQKHSTALMIR